MDTPTIPTRVTYGTNGDIPDWAFSPEFLVAHYPPNWEGFKPAPTIPVKVTDGKNEELPDWAFSPEFLVAHYPPNEEPMADAIRLEPYLLAMLWPLVERFGKLPNTFMRHNVYIYYLLGDTHGVVAPDWMLAFDVDLERLGPGQSYHLWMVGKPPELVVEIGSASTASRDLNEKRVIYARMGVPEYWLFDPPDGRRYRFILKGLRLVNGEYVEIPMVEGPGDDIRGHSDALGLDVCWENGAIRFYDPVASEYLNNQEETLAALAATEAARQTAEAARQTAEAARQTAEAARQTAEAARQTAEAEIRRLRAKLSDRT